MSVSTKKQRTKGGVKPSSSEKAANALQQLGSSGFVTFDTLANEEPSVLEVVRAPGGSLPEEQTSGNASNQEYEASHDSQEEIESTTGVILKKLTKKDPATRCRALRELMDTISGDRAAEYATALTRTFVAKWYSRCVADENAHVRELTNQVFKRVADTLDEIAKRRLAQFLRCGLPSLLLSLHDEVPSVASVAQSVFSVLFDGAADGQSGKRRTKAVFAVRESVAELVETTLTELGELRRREGDERRSEEGAKGDHLQQRAASAYRLLSFAINSVLAFAVPPRSDALHQLLLRELLGGSATSTVVTGDQRGAEQAEVASFLERTCGGMLIRNDRFWKVLNASDKPNEASFASLRCAAFHCARTLLFASGFSQGTEEKDCESILRRVANSALRNMNSSELRVADEAERTLRTLVRLEKAASESMPPFWCVVDAMHFALPQLNATLNALTKSTASPVAPSTVSRRVALVVALLKSLLRHRATQHDKSSESEGATKDSEALSRFVGDVWSRVLDVVKQPRVAVSEDDYNLISRKLFALTRSLLAGGVVEREKVSVWFMERLVGDLLLGAAKPPMRRSSWQLTVQRVAALLRDLDAHAVGNQLAELSVRGWPPKRDGDGLFEQLDRALLLLAALVGVPNCPDSLHPRSSCSLTDLRFEPFLELVTNQPDLLAEFLDDEQQEKSGGGERILVPAQQCTLVRASLRSLLDLFALHTLEDDACAIRLSVLMHLVAVCRTDPAALSLGLQQLAGYLSSSASSDADDSEAGYFAASLSALLFESEPDLRPLLLQSLVGPQPVRIDLLLTVLERFSDSALAKAIESHDSMHAALRNTVLSLTQSEKTPSRAARRTLQRCIALLCAKSQLASLRSQLFQFTFNSCRDLLQSVEHATQQRTVLQRCETLFEPLLSLADDSHATEVYELLVEFEFEFDSRAEQADAEFSSLRQQSFCVAALPTLTDFAIRKVQKLAKNFADDTVDCETTKRALDTLVSLLVEAIGRPEACSGAERLVGRLSELLQQLESVCLALLAGYVDLAFVADSRVLCADDSLGRFLRFLFTAVRAETSNLCDTFEQQAVAKLKSSLVCAYLLDQCCAAVCKAAEPSASVAKTLLSIGDRVQAVATACKLILQFGYVPCIRMSELHAASQCFPLLPNWRQDVPSSTVEDLSASFNQLLGTPVDLASLMQTANRLETLLTQIRSQFNEPDDIEASANDVPKRFRFPHNVQMPATLLELIDLASLHLNALTASSLDSDTLHSVKRLLDAVCNVKPGSVASDPVGYHVVMRFVLAALRCYVLLSSCTVDDDVFACSHFDYAVCRISDTLDFFADRPLGFSAVHSALLSCAAAALRTYYRDVLDDNASRSDTQRVLLSELRTEFSAVFEADVFSKLARLFVALCQQHVQQDGHSKQALAAALCRSLCTAVLASPKQPLAAALEPSVLRRLLTDRGIQSDCVYVSLAASDLLAKHNIAAEKVADTDIEADESCRLPNWLTALLQSAACRFRNVWQLTELPALSETVWDLLDCQLSHEAASCALQYLLAIRQAVLTFETAAIQVRSRYAAQLTERTEGQSLLDSLLRTLFSLMPRTAQLARVAQLQQSRSHLLSLAADCLASQEPLATLVSAVALSTYVRTLSAMPALIRDWRAALDRRAQTHVDRITSSYVSPSLIRSEMRCLSDAHARDAHGELRVQTSVKTREVLARYAVAGGELTLELNLKLPENYPIGFVDVAFDTRRIGVPVAKWRKWLLQLSTFMQQQNGSLYECLLIWKRNVDTSFDGVDDCMICYSVIHAGTYQTPQKQCSRCKKRFHADCLFRWFTTSQNATCPLCRELF